MRRYIALLALITCLCSSCFFLGPSHSHRLKIARKDSPLDAAIIPGFPFKNGQWDSLTKARILWAVYLYKKRIVTNLIFSGNAVYTPYVEGKLMALYAIALGVDSNHIFIDTLAEHSTENLYYGYKLARQHNFTKIALATDPFQCAMLYKFSKKRFQEKIYFLPIVYDSIEQYTATDPIVDVRSATVENFTPITSRMSNGKRLEGTRGKNIQFHKE